MKRCPTCNRVETDDTLAFCRADGTALASDSLPPGTEAGTARLGFGSAATEIETSILPHTTSSGMGRATGPTTALPAQQTPPSTHELTKLKRHKIAAVTVVIVTALFAAVSAVVVNSYLSGRREKPIESIAVLPFVNKSADANSEYLSDGLAESLIYRLSQLPNLKVSPTSSVIRYKGRETDIAQIAKELEVDAVMSGRLAQRGDDLTIRVELIDSRTRKLLWAEQYDRKMSDLLATQREIATTITQKLQLKLTGTDTKGITKRYTESNEAYQLYLKGRYHYAKRTKDDILKGIEYFRQAIKLDPNFALAYAEIADSYATSPAYPYLSPNEAFPQAKAAAKRALEIDPTLAEAHASLAYSLAIYDWNWAEAEREFKRALELDPDNFITHVRYAITFHQPLGRMDEAVRELEHAVELEPVNLVGHANLFWSYMLARQNERALERAKKTYELEPNFVLGRYLLGLVYNVNGMYAEAIALSEESLRAEPTSQMMLQVAGYAYAKTGRRQDAEKAINRFKDIAKTQYVMSYYVAGIYAALGERDEAFSELGKAYQERDWRLPLLKVDPFMDPLRDDPRFKEMLKRLNLPE